MFATIVAHCLTLYGMFLEKYIRPVCSICYCLLNIISVVNTMYDQPPKCVLVPPCNSKKSNCNFLLTVLFVNCTFCKLHPLVRVLVFLFRYSYTSLNSYISTYAQFMINVTGIPIVMHSCIRLYEIPYCNLRRPYLTY